MRKVNMVTLDEEYWYALSDCYESYGFKSRQEFIESMLVNWVNENAQESLEKGLKKMRFMESGRAVADKKKAMPPIVIKSHTGMYERRLNPIRLTFKDGRVETVEADTVLNALIMVELEPGLTERDLAERVEKFEYLEQAK